MSALSIQPTFPTFTDSDGTALDDGYIWIGVAGSDPISTPLTAYWDAALTQVVTQPVRTRGGYPLNAGAIGRLYVNSNYSIKVRNRNGFDLYSSLTATERYNDVVVQVDASDVTYTPAGTGAVATTVQTKLRESVSVFDFMTAAQIADVQAGTASVDVTAAIQAAINSGADNIYAPPGTYKITSTVTLSTTRDLTFHGAGRDATAFVTSINDGSSVFTISGQWHDIGDFKVTSTTGSLLNFIGVRLGRISTSTSFARSKATGIKVSNAAVGIEVYGWINDLDLFYTGCTLGVNGKELNSCVIELRGENNVTGFDLTNVYGTTFSNILEENTFAAGATTGTSLIRRGNAVTIGSIYLEGGTFSTTVLAFGNGSDFIQGLTVAQIKSTVAPADGSPAVLVDRVQGVCIEGVVTNDNRGAVSFGTEVRAIQPQLFTYSANATANTITNSLHDNSRQIRQAETWFGDTFLYRTLATFDTVTKTSVTTSNYVDLFITGKQSLRIISGTGVASTSLAVRRTASNFPGLINLVGRRIKMLAWVYVPNLAKFADRTYQPAIQISVGGGGSASSTSQRTCAYNGWNLVETTGITIPAGWTGTGSDYLELKFFVNDTANTVVDASYYILIDSIFITDRDVNILDIQRGNWIDVPLMGVSTDGDRLTVRSDNFTSVVNGDAAMKVGDQMLAWTPTAGGFIGRVCTTAGALGTTAVFKTWGAVSV